MKNMATTTTMAHRMTAMVFVVNLAGLQPARATAQFEDVKTTIEHMLVEQQIPSMAVAVAQAGKIVWEEGFGWADREKRYSATEHTMYSLASISKPITATGLMILVERGLVDLDRPINEYLGNAKVNGRAFDASGATVRRVANHTAGLPLHYQFFYEDEPFRRPHMDETIRRYGNLVTAPGERYQYSNLGFGIIDYVIARMSGKSYPDFMREEIFHPLGLTRTSVDIGPGLTEYIARRYAPDGTPIPFYDFDHPGGSAVFSSAHDLVRFGMFHLKNRLSDQRAVISDESIDRMATPTVETSPQSGYGIGWATGHNTKGLRRVRHSGGMGGVSTRLELFPDEDIVIVVLCNTSSSAPSEIVELIISTLVPDKVDPATTTPSNSTENAEPPTGPVFSPLPALTGTWVGHVSTYEGEKPITMTVHASGAIHVKLEGQLWTLLNGTTYEAEFLRGTFTADIGTQDVNRRPYQLRLEVKKRGDVLNGSLIGQSLPANRLGNALTHWVELHRR